MCRSMDVGWVLAAPALLLLAAGCSNLASWRSRQNTAATSSARPGVDTHPAPPLQIGTVPTQPPAVATVPAQPALPADAPTAPTSSALAQANPPPLPPLPANAVPTPVGGTPTRARLIDDGLQAQAGSPIRQTPAPGVPQPSLRETVPAPAATAPPAQPVPAADGRAKLRELYKLAVAQYDTIDGYTARLRRREQVNGKDNPEELLLFRFRKQPFSVYMKWTGPVATGREVTYVQDQYENKIYTKLAKTDSFLMGGKVMGFLPDSPMVRNSSRHSIHEAGLGTLIVHFGRLLDAADRGDRSLGTVAYVGAQTRPEFPRALDGIEQAIPAGAEPQLPGGGRRLVLVDPVSHLPVLVSTRDQQGHEVEYYCYDNLQFPVHFSDDHFNPDRLWGNSRR
jgi:hypothetical protein